MSKSTWISALVAALALAGTAKLYGQTVPPATPAQEDQLIAVLKSGATHKEKVDACRDLALVGTKDAVPVLAALLGDEKLAHMARYALEPIPDPVVDDALRDALDKLNGRLLVGVVASLGVRRDAKSVKPIAKLLQDPDRDVAQAAARALGRIGTTEAAKVLEENLASAPAVLRAAVADGCLACAEALLAQDKRSEAAALYGSVGKADLPSYFRVAAKYGALLSR